MQQTILDFIRHGEPLGGRKFRGHGIDDPLSEKGWQQMWAAVGDACPWDAIVSSPLERCRAFAAAVAQQHGIRSEINDGFREVGFGSWEGQAPDDLARQRQAEYAAFYQDPVNCRPAGAEPLQDFGSRVADAMESTRAAYPGQRVLVVAHAGVIRAALGHVTGAPAVAWYRARVGNAAITQVVHGEFGWQLVTHNCANLS